MPSWSDSRGNITSRYTKITSDPATRRREFSDLNVRCVLFPPDRKKHLQYKEDSNPFTQALAKDGWRRLAVNQVGDYNVWLAPQK